MAINWKRTGRYTPAYSNNRDEEKPISCNTKRVTVNDLLAIQKAMRESGITEGEVNLQDPEVVEKIWASITYVIGEYTSDWDNLYVDGKAVTTSIEVLENSDKEFMPYLAETFNHILGISVVNEDDKKKLEQESEPKN